jgi:streptogramin lyase
MTTGPDNALWFLDNEPSTGGLVGRTTLTGNTTTYVVPNAPTYLGSKLVSGPDGNLWFGQYFGPGIARIDTSGNIQVFPVACGDVNGVTVGPDGDIWFTQPQCHSYGKMTTDGAVTRYQLGAGYGPYGIVASGQTVWFAASTTQIAEATTDGNVIFFTIADNPVAPAQVAPDAQGDIWFTEDQNNAIGMLTPTGGVSSFPLPTGGRASSLAEGSDGAMWFTDPNLNEVGRVTPGGEVDQFPVPMTSVQPSGMTIGPDHSLWFTAQAASSIGHITLSR